MTSIKLNKSSNNSFTLISNKFIDTYMPQADGTYVKVYLYLLRCITGNSDNITICSIADALDTSDRDIVRALAYWERVNLIQIDKNPSGEITSINFMDSDVTISSVESEEAKISTVLEEPATSISNDEIIPMEMLLDNADFREMIAIIEGMLNRPVNNIDISLITNLYSKYNFKSDLIVYLYEVCVDKCNGNSTFIEKVGMDWAAFDVKSIDEADDYSSKYRDTYYGVLKAFGINNRVLGSEEINFLKRWIKEYRFGKDFIVLACQKSLKHTQIASFDYAESVLKRWYDNKVTTLEDIERLDKEHKEQEKKHPKNTTSTTSSNVHKFNFEQRNYSDTDFDDLEKRAIAKYIK